MNIMQIWDALKAGKVVANPESWKKKQVTVNQVTFVIGALLLLLKGTKYDPHMDDTTVGYIGAGIFGLVNWLFTVITTDKIGVFGHTAPAVPAAPLPAADAAPDAAAAQPDPVDLPAVGAPPAPAVVQPSADGSTDENGYLRG